MRLTKVLRAKKHEVSFGAWAPGHIPPSAFRLNKQQKTLKFGASWSWRVVRFLALESAFRILIMVNEDKGICRTTLGHEYDDLVRICCVHEFHPSEPGWHCHAVSNLSDGVAHWSHFGLKRWPRGWDSQATFSADRVHALNAALEFYRVSVTGDLL